MRIIAGRARGTKLATLGPGDPDNHLRPTTDRVRENIFNLLNSHAPQALKGTNVLDMFAGTGALGLEALSRGANHVTFVENAAKGRRLIDDNIAKLRAESETTILQTDATKLPKARRCFDLVFLDPPYGQKLGELALSHAIRQGWLSPGATIVWEDSMRAPVMAEIASLSARQYGQTWISILTYQAKV